MAVRGNSSLFRVAERAVVTLYDGGVLSPAVLQCVLEAFIGAKMQWDTDVEIRAVDGRTMHDIVMTTPMPGDAPEHAASEFARIIAHLRTGEAVRHAPSDAPMPTNNQDAGHDHDEPSGEDAALIDRLGAARGPKRKHTPSANRRTSKPSPGFNPLVNARLPGKR
ncbi:hypothetical protein [Paraburkholderia sp. XV]|uniref:hypothetical protein n=1 Tax=Paraburkholderia sp. XV TaxID=2831520 RepID=UPI001CD456D1|nr:hypothetical protein [Paraburkholderia sp. XV]